MWFLTAIWFIGFEIQLSQSARSISRVPRRLAWSVTDAVPSDGQKPAGLFRNAEQAGLVAAIAGAASAEALAALAATETIDADLSQFLRAYDHSMPVDLSLFRDLPDATVWKMELDESLNWEPLDGADVGHLLLRKLKKLHVDEKYSSVLSPVCIAHGAQHPTEQPEESKSTETAVLTPVPNSKTVKPVETTEKRRVSDSDISLDTRNVREKIPANTITVDVHRCPAFDLVLQIVNVVSTRVILQPDGAGIVPFEIIGSDYLGKLNLLDIESRAMNVLTALQQASLTRLEKVDDVDDSAKENDGLSSDAFTVDEYEHYAVTGLSSTARRLKEGPFADEDGTWDDEEESEFEGLFENFEANSDNGSDENNDISPSSSEDNGGNGNSVIRSKDGNEMVNAMVNAMVDDETRSNTTTLGEEALPKPLRESHASDRDVDTFFHPRNSVHQTNETQEKQPEELHLLLDSFFGQLRFKQRSFPGCLPAGNIGCFGEAVLNGTDTFWLLEAMRSGVVKKSGTRWELTDAEDRIGLWMTFTVPPVHSSHIADTRDNLVDISLVPGTMFKPTLSKRKVAVHHVDSVSGAVKGTHVVGREDEGFIERSARMQNDLEVLVSLPTFITLDLSEVPWTLQVESTIDSADGNATFTKAAYFYLSHINR